MINNTVKEEELQDIYQATIAVEREAGHTEQEAQQAAQTLSYGVFRDLFTKDSVIKHIVDRAIKVFNH